MTAFPVNPEKAQQLAQRKAALGVRESDIEESFVRSGGHGGQNVNKSATCVTLLHRPTRLQVKCQKTRQQGLNRFIAWRSCWTKLRHCRPVAWLQSDPTQRKSAGRNDRGAAKPKRGCSPINPIMQTRKLPGASAQIPGLERHLPQQPHEHARNTDFLGIRTVDFNFPKIEEFSCVVFISFYIQPYG